MMAVVIQRSISVVVSAFCFGLLVAEVSTTRNWVFVALFAIFAVWNGLYAVGIVPVPAEVERRRS